MNNYSLEQYMSQLTRAFLYTAKLDTIGPAGDQKVPYTRALVKDALTHSERRLGRIYYQ